MKYSDTDLDNRFGHSEATTFADYQNFRNVLFQLSQELNKAYVNYSICRNSELRAFKKEFIRKYKELYPQVNNKNMLSHLDKKERDYLNYFYLNSAKINRASAVNINEILFKLMNDFGVYNISKQVESYR